MATTNFVDGVTPLIASWHNDVDKATYTNKDYGNDIGAANAYVVNLAVAKTAYYDGLRVDFSTANANTAAASLNVNGLGAIQIFNQGGIALEVGQIRANTIMSVAYNAATNAFEVLNTSAADATAKANAARVLASAGNVPIGGFMDFGGLTPPPNYIVRPAAQTIVPIASYPLLAAEVLTNYGGDGITTFGLPFLPAGYADISSADGAVGSQSVGAVIAHTHTLVDNQFGGANTVSAAGTPFGLLPNATASTGGAANLAAGIRCLKCVRYQ